MPVLSSAAGSHLPQTAVSGSNQLRDQSPFKPPEPPEPFDPFDPFDPPHIPDTEVSELFTPDADFTFPDEVANETTDESLDKDTCSQQRTEPRSAKLKLLDINEWDEEKTYNEDPPSCIHYSIEWKLTLNNKLITKDTKQDLVLAPTFYWLRFLQPKLEKLLRKKLPNKRVTADDTNAVVSVTERSERDLTKRFDDTDINWSVIEKQLVAWGELFRAGKKLRVDLSFNYLETGQPPPTSSRRGDKRGISSTTQQMLTERATQLDAEEESSGQPSIWQDVYSLMRCPGPPCHLGPHCWRDPVGKKHYKLKTHQLKGLIRHVEQGGRLRTHDDVPEDIRQQLYAEEQQRLERQQKTTNVSSSNIPPINITNVLPGPSHQPFVSASPMGTPPPVAPPITRLVVPGFRDIALKEYCDWQQSKVVDETLKAEYQKAYDVALEHGLDLEQIHMKQNSSFFVDQE
ncbi:MAG: hypothetical protein M1839_007913 [Geoglossum umbratile]|nr:MAG: hypothetical protein M1839_007913 [Geoglossum umbratile]